MLDPEAPGGLYLIRSLVVTYNGFEDHVEHSPPRLLEKDVLT